MPGRRIARHCNDLERAGRVKGGADAERSEGTLEATEHSETVSDGESGGPFLPSKPGSILASAEAW